MEPYIAALEEAVDKLPIQQQRDDVFHPARRMICLAIAEPGHIDVPAGASLADHIERAATAPTARRQAAVVVLRCLSVPGLIPQSDNENQIRRKIITLCVAGVPDICKQFGVDVRTSNHDALQKLEGVFDTVCTKLNRLEEVIDRVDALVAARQDLLRNINSSLVKAFLRIYDGVRITNGVETTLASLDELVRLRDTSFPTKLAQIRSFIGDEQEYVSASRSFASRIYTNFLRKVADALDKLDNESRHLFECEITLTAINGQIEKRYPLGDPERTLVISLPFENRGPGTAIDVTVTKVADADGVAFNRQTDTLGDIRPGRFAHSFEALVLEPVQALTLQLEVGWNRVGTHERLKKEFTVAVRGQPTSLDWASLAELDPYSTEVARGDEFVGREQKLHSLVARLTTPRMVSSYITGQKRVGKSSLAYAVRDRLERRTGDSQFRVLYLEWGDYSHHLPEGTLRNLGQQIADFVSVFIPVGINVPSVNFDGSLSDLGRLFNVVIRHNPSLKFVIMLDEFDATHPELYRIGPLADTFFSNIRSISTKDNVAFILIGGEKMPFIIQAQGDELNKFVHEELSYFSRISEWDDFCALIELPTASIINWHTSALNALFNATNGQPYFTKLLCRRVYTRAVMDRDADVTEEEVRRAYDDVTSSLDINSFAHIWKDGVKGTREEEEIVALQRCRLLVATGRAFRETQSVTAEAIDNYKGTSKLNKSEVAPLLGEFCRRGFMVENSGSYEITLPLFRDWLVERGMTALVADTLGDELAEQAQSLDEKAYVRSEEVRELLDGWGSYRGQKVSGDDVRAWLEQAGSRQRQRLLFKLLLNLRFVRETEILEKLRSAHSGVIRALPEFIQRKKTDTRRDVIVTHVDGPGKSGAYYASLYAQENKIWNDSVLALSGFNEQAYEHEQRINTTATGVIIVDDIISSGRSICENITAFLKENRTFIIERNIPLFVVTMLGCSEGVERVRKFLAGIEGIETDLRVCEMLNKKHFAFVNQPGIWSSNDEFYEAKALCQEIGTALIPKAPLGYASQGLLVVFPQTVPNNTLPLLYADAVGSVQWRCLFRRPR